MPEINDLEIAINTQSICDTISLINMARVTKNLDIVCFINGRPNLRETLEKLHYYCATYMKHMNELSESDQEKVKKMAQLMNVEDADDLYGVEATYYNYMASQQTNGYSR